METSSTLEALQTGGESGCDFSTNWEVSGGSLRDSITFETPDSPPIQTDTVTPPKSPLLILKPPPSAPDSSSPCEITISFTQRHEIRQVYVRSTARVYEIYYAPASQNDNEYLCTVRCSIADIREDVLHASNVEKHVCPYLEVSNGVPAEDKVASESNISTYEDDWVDVEIPAALRDDSNKSSKQTTSNVRRSQDLYEATAEINDSDPCLSITLRLLSLQNKACIHIDEVYIFAEPIESTTTDNGVQVGNSVNSTLMAMLVPSIMQLSKSRVGQLQYPSRSMMKGEDLESESKASCSSNLCNGIQQDEKFNIPDTQNEKLQGVHQEMSSHGINGAEDKTKQLQIPSETSDGKRICDSVAKDDHPYNQVEKVLEQLMSRMSKIEDICSRFEENMLKPISSMDARLQRVEQQVEVLAKNSQHYGLPTCRRFSAPAFSSDESDYNSPYVDMKDTTSNRIYIPPEQSAMSVSSPQTIPGLVVIAPEFSCCDEEDNAPEPLKNSSLEKTKKAVSIDDALAAALAGFSSMTDTQVSSDIETVTIAAPELAGEGTRNDGSLRPSQALRVTAPEFIEEENINEVNLTSPTCQNEESSLPLEPNRVGNIGAGSSISTHSSSIIEGLSQPIEILDDFSFEGKTQVDNRQGPFSDRQTTLKCESDHENDKHEDFQLTEEISSRISISDTGDIPKNLSIDHTANVSQPTELGSSASTKLEDGPSNIPGLLYASRSVVDFESPILEVKFSSIEDSSVRSPLEALLLTDGEIALVDDFVVSMEQSEEESESSDQNHHLLVEFDGNGNDVEVLIDMGGEGSQDHLTHTNQELVVSLI